MNRSIRSILAISILAIVLAACAGRPSAPVSEQPSPSQPSTPSVEPSAEPSVAPSEAPADEEREVAGTITVAEGMTVSGPGGTITEALEAGNSGETPTLVNGVLFLDTDGTIYLATAVSDASEPAFDGRCSRSSTWTSDAPEFDMANAEALGLEEANGIVFRQKRRSWASSRSAEVRRATARSPWRGRSRSRSTTRSRPRGSRSGRHRGAPAPRPSNPRPARGAGPS